MKHPGHLFIKISCWYSLISRSHSGKVWWLLSDPLVVLSQQSCFWVPNQTDIHIINQWPCQININTWVHTSTQCILIMYFADRLKELARSKSCVSGSVLVRRRFVSSQVVVKSVKALKYEQEDQNSLRCVVMKQHSQRIREYHCGLQNMNVSPFVSLL